MAHDTTLPVQACKGISSPPGESSDNGAGAGRPHVEVDGQRFRVRTPRFSTQWLPDTPGNRHLSVVWFRLLVDEHGKALFTLQA